jgi:hypothetical protein
MSQPLSFEHLQATYRKFSATRPCGSEGIGRCDTTTKLRLSSSGCESRPAKGKPARAGS